MVEGEDKGAEPYILNPHSQAINVSWGPRLLRRVGADGDDRALAVKICGSPPPHIANCGLPSVSFNQP